MGFMSWDDGKSDRKKLVVEMPWVQRDVCIMDHGTLLRVRFEQGRLLVAKCSGTHLWFCIRVRKQ